MLTKNNRVKEFYKKIGTGQDANAEVFYFGTDGQLVDMFSGLDLEEQLKLDGPSRIMISQDENSFKVIEYYSDYKEHSTIYYSVVTQINESSEDWIIDNNQMILTSSLTSGLIAQSNQTSNVENGHFITITLYKGQYDPNPDNQSSNIELHKRFIDFENDVEED